MGGKWHGLAAWLPWASLFTLLFLRKKLTKVSLPSSSDSALLYRQECQRARNARAVDVEGELTPVLERLNKLYCSLT